MSILDEITKKLSTKITLFYARESISFGFVNNLQGFVKTQNDFIYDWNLKLEKNKKKLTIVERKELSLRNIVDIMSATNHFVARSINGRLYYWEDESKIKNEKCSHDRSPLKKEVSVRVYVKEKNIIDISCGLHHSLALSEDGLVYGWGYNNWGQTGSGTGKYKDTMPKKLKGFDNEKVKAISCGGYHSLALTSNGRVYSWGYNGNGQLGQGKIKASPTPRLLGLRGSIITGICCGLEHSILLEDSGAIFTFGNNSCGQLGIGNYFRKELPQKLLNMNKIIDIKSYYSKNVSIALTENNVFYVWGECKEKRFTRPQKVKYKSFEEIFTDYYQITCRAINLNERQRTDLVEERGIYDQKFEEISNLSNSGSYGQVYKVAEKGSDKFYAIKKIQLNKIYEKEIYKDLTIISKMKNDRIVKIQSSWFEQNWTKINVKKDSESLNQMQPEKYTLLHIQMELLSMTLKDVIALLKKDLKRENINYFIRCELFKEILDCVDFIHRLKPPKVHKNLKPSNFLISSGVDGRFVKMTDFGFSVANENFSLTHIVDLSSLKFLAPEVMKLSKYDEKSDIYSLGVLMQDLFDFDINE
jgi:hypothetical protein